MSNYSTITNNSTLRAIGPYRETLTYQAAGNVLARGLSHLVSVGGYVSLQPQESKQDSSSPLHLIVQEDLLNSAYASMLASEAILALNWDTPEDDAAWADL